MKQIPIWTVVVPLISWLLLGGIALGWGGAFLFLAALGLGACVIASVHHAEVIAHYVGEPFGTLVLAVAVTVIEVALIVSLMLSGGPSTAALARDTVFAAVMIILNGMIGVCLLVGGSRHGEQTFGLYGVSAALTTLAAISVLTLILPNYTTSASGASYSTSQLVFIAIVSLVLYGAFVLIQTIKHRHYFLTENGEGDEVSAEHRPPRIRLVVSSIALLASLGAVVLLAKSLAPVVEAGVVGMGAPQAVVGIIIAGVILLPEGFAAYRAARANRLQTSLNLALGSALASIGLTIPTVAILSVLTGWQITLGLEIKSSVLLLLSLFVASLSLSTGKTTILQGTVHLVIFAVYVFITLIP